MGGVSTAECTGCKQRGGDQKEVEVEVEVERQAGVLFGWRAIERVKVGRHGRATWRELSHSLLGVGASSMELRVVERRLCVSSAWRDQGHQGTDRHRTRFKKKIVTYPPPSTQ